MAWRLYVIPSIGTGARDDVYRPKYVEALGVNYSAMPYKRGVAFLVAADVSDEQDAALGKEADVERVSGDTRQIKDPDARALLTRAFRLGPITR